SPGRDPSGPRRNLAGKGVEDGTRDAKRLPTPVSARPAARSRGGPAQAGLDARAYGCGRGDLAGDGAQNVGQLPRELSTLERLDEGDIDVRTRRVSHLGGDRIRDCADVIGV